MADYEVSVKVPMYMVHTVTVNADTDEDARE